LKRERKEESFIIEVSDFRTALGHIDKAFGYTKRKAALNP